MNFINRAKAVIQAGFTYIGAVNPSSKAKKNETVSGQHTYMVYLAPAKTSGYNVCSHSTPECRRGCLATSGRAGMELNAKKKVTRIEQARLKKTRLFYEQPEFFMAWMIAEIKAKQALAEKKNMGFSIRLNGTSDIDWQNVKVNGKSIFEIFPDITFYDYTKNPNKFIGKPDNHHLTLSYTGRNWKACDAVLKQGVNVAVVFDVKRASDIPATFRGYDVINGDITDYRVDDAKGIIVGLKWKHIADKEAEAEVLNSCFVVKPEVEVTNVQAWNVVMALNELV